MENTVGSLTEKQKSIITGKLLGDGSLRRKKNTLLEVNHSINQKEYVFWVYQNLRNLVRTPPKLRKSGKNRLSFRFTTLSHASLNEFYSRFYSTGGKKVIPTSLTLNGLSLAVWYMDDGSKSRRSGYLNTQQFTYQDQLLLLGKLSDLGLKATLNKDKSYHRIRLSQETIGRFVDLVRPNMIQSMLYKLP
jgi:hypothetical protein